MLKLMKEVFVAGLAACLILGAFFGIMYAANGGVCPDCLSESGWKQVGAKDYPVLGLHGAYISQLEEFALLENQDGILYLREKASCDCGAIEGGVPQRISGEFDLKRTNPKDWMSNETYELKRTLPDKVQIYRIEARGKDKYQSSYINLQLDRIEKPEQPPK